MAARKRTWTPQIVRDRMRAAAISKRLQQFALGEKDEGGLPVNMTPAQVTAALGILKKCVPDLSAVEHSGEIAHKHTRDMTDEELAAIAAGGSVGAAVETEGASEPPSIQ